jgi:hypothetical protein
MQCVIFYDQYPADDVTGLIPFMIKTVIINISAPVFAALGLFFAR